MALKSKFSKKQSAPSIVPDADTAFLQKIEKSESNTDSLALTPNQKRSLSLKGNTNAMKHGIFSTKAPSMMCDNCYLVRSVQDANFLVDPRDVKCPHYKPQKACIYACCALDNNIRDVEDVKVVMEEAVELDVQRIQMARAIEVFDGGGVLDQSVDLGMERYPEHYFGEDI